MMDCGLKDNVLNSLPQDMVLEYEKTIYSLSNGIVMLSHTSQSAVHKSHPGKQFVRTLQTSRIPVR